MRLRPREIIDQAQAAFRAGKIDREQLREVRVGARLPFAARLIEREYAVGDGIPWGEIDWERFLEFLTGLFQILLTFITGLGGLGGLGLTDEIDDVNDRIGK